MSQGNLFELCAEDVVAAQAAQTAGADRIELCEQLEIGGVTPSAELLSATMAAVEIPVHVLIRPRGGDFVYSDAEMDAIRAQVREAKAAGAAGVVIGVLLPNGNVDVERTRELAQLARPMKVTFHRAFDVVRDQQQGLEDVIRSGADCLLTSGGAQTMLEGAEQIGRLQRQAGTRLQVLAGGGLKLESLAEFVRRSGVTWLHGSLSRENGTEIDTHMRRRQLEQDIREAVRELRREWVGLGR